MTAPTYWRALHTAYKSYFLFSARQFVKRGFFVGISHKGFTYENCVYSCVFKHLDVIPCFNSAFGNKNNVVWNKFTELCTVIYIHREVTKISVVYTDNSCSCAIAEYTSSAV